MGYPQIVTQITENGAKISTIVDAPWVSVTSVNGMTGDVLTEVQLKAFEPYHFYKKDTGITYNGMLYYARADFDSGATFNENDWIAVQIEQVQADWNETSSSSKAYIKNKPTSLTDIDPSYVAYSSTEKIKLNGIENGAEVNVQSDWNEGDSSADAYIQNKPSIPTKTSDLTNDSDFTTKTYVDTELEDVTVVDTDSQGHQLLYTKDGSHVYPIVGGVLPDTIGTSEIKDGAVTNDKMTYTKGVDTNSSYAYLGDILIQWGQKTGATTSNVTFNMPKAFANTNYTLTLTSQYNEAGGSFWWANIISKSTQSFVARGGYHAVDGSGGGGNTNNVLNWIAIGQKA